MSIIVAVATMCYVTLHGPDGEDLIKVDAASILVIRPATRELKRHVVKGVNSIVHVGVEKFGVGETPQQIEELVKNCEEKHQ